jgi:xanthine dehydrogenase accessory factor
MNPSALLARFREWRDQGNPMVLALVTKAAGSTYAKPGAMMLIGEQGTYQGLLSGGCLEGDLMSRAEPVFQSGQSASVIYDMRDQEQDQLWGLGLGCGGMMEIRLIALDPVTDHFPLGAINSAVQERCAGSFGIMVNAERGAGLVVTPRATHSNGVTEVQQGVLEPLLSNVVAAEVVPSSLGEVFVAPLPLPAKLLILGAGPDALPVVQLAQAQGWQVEVADHRPAYNEQFVAAGGPEVKIIQADQLATEFDLNDFDAAVVMSHHLNTDRHYLRSLADTAIPYLGSLGPPDRRDQLLNDLKTDLGDDLSRLTKRLYAPIGLEIGARGPEGIALSICAEIQSVLSGNSAGHMGPPLI